MLLSKEVLERLQGNHLPGTCAHMHCPLVEAQASSAVFLYDRVDLAGLGGKHTWLRWGPLRGK